MTRQWVLGLLPLALILATVAGLIWLGDKAAWLLIGLAGVALFGVVPLFLGSMFGGDK